MSAKDPPTDCTEFTEPSAGDNLPQISQICTDCLGAEDSSGGILASAAAKCLPQNLLCWGWPPTEFTDLHRWLGFGRFSHRTHGIHRTVCWGWSPTDFTDLHRTSCCVYSPTELTEFTEPANFRGCTCLKCTNQANSCPPTDFTDLHRSC